MVLGSSTVAEIQLVFCFSFSWRHWKTNYLNRSKLTLCLFSQVWSTLYRFFKSKFVPSSLYNALLKLLQKSFMNSLKVVKVDLKFKEKPWKINVKDFILGSVYSTIPIIWNTFSRSRKFFPFRWTYMRWKLLIKFDLIHFSY